MSRHIPMHILYMLWSNNNITLKDTVFNRNAQLQLQTYLLQGTITAVQKRSYTPVIKNVCLLREKRLIICAETWDIECLSFPPTHCWGWWSCLNEWMMVMGQTFHFLSWSFPSGLKTQIRDPPTIKTGLAFRLMKLTWCFVSESLQTSVPKDHITMFQSAFTINVSRSRMWLSQQKWWRSYGICVANALELKVQCARVVKIYWLNLIILAVVVK